MKQDEALDILKTGASVFLTGQPGSGKSHVALRYVRCLRREGIPVSITASTGIAAAQLGGITIHAWSGIGTKSRIAKADLERIAQNRRVSGRLGKARVLVVDEVSMLSGETLTGVDLVCRHLRQSSLPFGGLQVVLVGDFFQLPPVIRRDESAMLEDVWDDGDGFSPFAHASEAWRGLDPVICYLTEQHRQNDPAFSELLDAIRANACKTAHLELLASRKPSSPPANATRLYTHNCDVDRINQAELAKLPGKARGFVMSSTGDKLLAEGLKRGCLSPERLELKENAIVMFTRNDAEGRYVNGTLGVVTGFDGEGGYPLVTTKDGAITARPAEWKVNEDEKVKAAITQVPLRLAWAITVHKSQGMSLDRAVIDLSGAFEYGQGYVALSRVRSLMGLHLLGWNGKALRVHPEALAKDAEFRAASDAAAARLATDAPDGVPVDRRIFAGAEGQGLSPAAPAPGNRGGARSGGGNRRVGNAYKPWTVEEDAAVATRFKRGESIAAIAAAHERQAGGIRARLVKLGLILR